MASSNRHWPSLFKSKPCNNQQWQQQHDLNSCVRSSSSNSSFSSGCEERSPEPKPRWNPKPEQIRILEAIFNSGMVNPPRDEIRRIRAQLQEYGQVGDANVFYWFQNRKSRSKHKQRSSKLAAPCSSTAHQRVAPPMSASSSSSTTSSDKASPKKPKGVAENTTTTNDNINNNNCNSNVAVDQFGGMNNSPTEVNQCCSYFHHSNSSHDQFVGQEPVFFPLHQSGASVLGGGFSQGLGLGFGGGHDSIGVSVGPGPEHGVMGGGFSNLLLGEMIGGGGGGEIKREEVEKLKFQQELSFLVTNAPTNTTCTLPISAPNNVMPNTTSSSGVMSGNLGQLLGVGEDGGMTGKSTVFMDNMTIDVPVGSFNVKEAFGEDAMLVHPSGHPVLTNEWGVTIHPLQNGAFYYLVRPTVAASPLLDKLDSTPDLLASEYPYQI